MKLSCSFGFMPLALCILFFVLRFLFCVLYSIRFSEIVWACLICLISNVGGVLIEEWSLLFEFSREHTAFVFVWVVR